MAAHLAAGWRLLGHQHRLFGAARPGHSVRSSALLGPPWQAGRPGLSAVVRAIPAIGLFLHIWLRALAVWQLVPLTTSRHAQLWPNIPLPRLVYMSARHRTLHDAIVADGLDWKVSDTQITEQERLCLPRLFDQKIHIYFERFIHAFLPRSQTLKREELVPGRLCPKRSTMIWFSLCGKSHMANH